MTIHLMSSWGDQVKPTFYLAVAKRKILISPDEPLTAESSCEVSVTPGSGDGRPSHSRVARFNRRKRYAE